MSAVIKEGWATKQGGIIKSWKKRWFVLTAETFIYYVKSGAGEQGRIPIGPTCDAQPAPECKKQPSFKVITPGRTYFIVTETQEEMKEWIEAILDVVSILKGSGGKSKDPDNKNGEIQKKEFAKKMSMDDFKIVSVLGRGTYGKVQLIADKSNGKHYALKTMSKRLLAESDQIDQMLTERNVLLRTSHPFLVSAHCTFQTEAKVFMVLDYVPGGELFGRLKEEFTFSENRVRLYGAELILGLGHLHSLGFIYRDLKPENILVDLEGHLRITDFGLAKNINSLGGTTTSFCGTPEYIAPEMLQRLPYTKSADWWSFGILMFEMLTGLPPFYDENVNQMYKSVLRDEISFPSHVSPEAKDLISKLLDRNPNTRLGSGPNDSEDIKKHVFFSSLDWDMVYNKKLKPEWMPAIKSVEDTSMFDEEFTRETGGVSYEDGSLIEADTQSKFTNFTCIQDSELDKL